MTGGAGSDPKEAGDRSDPRASGQADGGTSSGGSREPVTSQQAPDTASSTEPSAPITDTSLVDVSESRLSVLKALEDGRRTASELARDLELNKSTVHGYLQDLVEDGFVQRHEEEDRLWVYYSLTKPGQAIVGRDRLTLVVDLGTLTAFLASATIGVYELFFAEPATPSGPGALGGPSGGSAGGLPWIPIAYASLLGLVVLGLLLHVHLRRRAIDHPQEAAS